MVSAQIVTEVEPRVVQYPRIINLPRLTQAPFGTPEHQQWVNDNFWMINYQVYPEHIQTAQRLAERLQQLFEKNPHDSAIPEVVAELRAIAIPMAHEMQPQQRWAHISRQLPDDIGGGSQCKAIISTYLSERYHGVVLEAMCGFNSYFPDAPTRVVTAQDYCADALRRYPFPARRRVLVDLNELSPRGRIELFPDKTFDVVSVCFGFRYLFDPPQALQEFYRILKVGGRLSFVENPKSGYLDLCRRSFSTDVCVRCLEYAGFSAVTSSRIVIDDRHPRSGEDKYFHIEATK